MTERLNTARVDASSLPRALRVAVGSKKKIHGWTGGSVSDFIVHLEGLPVTQPLSAGWWNQRSDWVTGSSAVPRTFSVRDRTYSLRADAPDRCPSGPCGESFEIARIS